MFFLNSGKKVQTNTWSLLNEDVVELQKGLKAQEGFLKYGMSVEESLKRFFKNNQLNEYVVTITPHI